jgi:hypothetical protein
MLLTHSIKHNGQILEISVYYTPSTNTVTEIKSIWVHSLGGKMPVTGILMHLFETEINKIVNQVDWREIYRAAMECDYSGEETNGINMNNINKTMVSYLAPHLLNH